ncbi:MAG: NUDIX domain-containing protein [Flavobacteriaceae bacterium]|jgi:8-oxo-dGTP diphosphatase|uniref:NUDIX hydrolase n=1 Tax=Flagellimonas TaxID=444459 RepID=UPI000E27F5D3|nr:NUDIX domain-containing protein [Allomuricauda sp.]MCR9263625.1 NUDIX domain-containing protein [Flavobacteriaceae bacterium]
MKGDLSAATLNGLNDYQVNEDSYECSMTTDIAVFGYVDNQLKILLTKRSVGNFTDHWMLPGGVLQANETLKDCAQKILFALTGFENIHFEQVKAYSEIDRHPTKRVITISFYALVKPENHPLTLKSGVEQIDWFDLDHIPANLGFDHNQIIRDAHQFFKKNLKDTLVVGELLPQKFTLPELQNLYENILGLELDKRNFRKRIFQMDILKNTGEKKPGVKGGPMLYSYKDHE